MVLRNLPSTWQTSSRTGPPHGRVDSLPTVAVLVINVAGFSRMCGAASMVTAVEEVNRNVLLDRRHHAGAWAGSHMGTPTSLTSSPARYLDHVYVCRRSNLGRIRKDIDNSRSNLGKPRTPQLVMHKRTFKTRATSSSSEESLLVATTAFQSEPSLVSRDGSSLPPACVQVCRCVDV
jgi:hypothetical protein